MECWQWVCTDGHFYTNLPNKHKHTDKPIAPPTNTLINTNCSNIRKKYILNNGFTCQSTGNTKSQWVNFHCRASNSHQTCTTSPLGSNIYTINHYAINCHTCLERTTTITDITALTGSIRERAKNWTFPPILTLTICDTLVRDPKSFD